MAHAAHFVQFYEAEDQLIAAVSRFVREGIEAGETCVVIASVTHRDSIDDRLRRSGLCPATLASNYRYIALDARLMLATLMTGGQPDQQRFHQNLDLLIRQVSAGGRPVRVFGEMVALLAEEGQWDAVLQLEELWNELSRQHPFTLFCAYPAGCFAAASGSKALVCAVHSHVIEASAQLPG